MKTTINFVIYVVGEAFEVSGKGNGGANSGSDEGAGGVGPSIRITMALIGEKINMEGFLTLKIDKDLPGLINQITN